jgi:hypothetical protein
MDVSLINNQTLEKIEFYILDGEEPVRTEDTLKWFKWFAREENWYVAKDIIDGNQIITFFLGTYDSLIDKQPIFFKTMVLGGKLDGEMNCYYTRQEAETGHKKMIERVKSNQ